MKLLHKTILVSLFFLAMVLLYSCQVSSAASSSCINHERQSLLRLKASLIDSSNRLASWKGTDCCNWSGVGCDHTNGRIVKLDLRNYEYTLSSALLSNSNGVDSSLFEFKFLNYLDLSGNSFNHTQIPDCLASLLELRYLNLSNAYFDGRIPHVLGNLTKLHVLDLNSLYPNSYGRTEMFIDDLRWVSSLSSLEYLDLSRVRLLQSRLDFIQALYTFPSLLSLKLRSCGIQNIDHLSTSLNSSFVSKLQHLDLSSNMVEGPVPNILQNMTSLRFLYLSSNEFNSSIPLWLGNLRNLVILQLDNNMFNSIEGGLSSIITNNCHLQQFDLSYNHFLGGDVFGSHENVSAGCKDHALENLVLANLKLVGAYKIPNWFGQLRNLKFLHLKSSSLYGPVPVSFGNLSRLQVLDISYNMLSGGIPTSLGKLSNLRGLDLRDNILDGVISENFGQLQRLEFLDLSNNALKGVVSEIHFVNLSRLESIFMAENGLLSFEMKHNWVPPFQLKLVSLRSTMGFGSTQFPQWIGTQKEISYLNLFNTNIVGPIPTWLRLQKLRFLDLSYNQITGSLPNSIDGQMPNLLGLFISNAHINGSLPRSLCRLKNLILLALSDNRLSGTILSCLSALDLDLLDLSSNKFFGVFPSSFQNLSNLGVMNLAKNQLKGEPLSVMRSFRSLCVLDLEGNQFSGSIPPWVGKSLTSLQILNLRGNMIEGTVPSTLWLLPQLQILILADNKLVGTIPPSVGNFSATPRPITDDSLVCEDPYAVCYVSYVRQVLKSSNFNYSYLQLHSMVNVDLSNNSLYGHIPSGVTTIKGLFGLNLSHNNLSGTIPMEIGGTVSLESLDLSFNQLSGSIPNSISSLSSLGVLKLSNNNFSGRIPREGHLSTFNGASSYEGNPYLCGEPLSVKCPNENSSEPRAEIDDDDDDDSHEEDKFEKMWFYIIVMLGYALGFWGVVGTLLLKRSWRRAYFQCMDETKDKIHGAMSMNMKRLIRRRRGNDSIHR